MRANNKAANKMVTHDNWPNNKRPASFLGLLPTPCHLWLLEKSKYNTPGVRTLSFLLLEQSSLSKSSYFYEIAQRITNQLWTILNGLGRPLTHCSRTQLAGLY
jgi:hypothetical protein